MNSTSQITAILSRVTSAISLESTPRVEDTRTVPRIGSFHNLKKSVDRRGLPEYWYKEDAIRRAAAALVRDLSPEFIQNGTFVPVPPSKATNDPLYDDRITQIIRLLGPNVDAREIVPQIASTTGVHLSQGRLGPQALYVNYEIEQSLIQPTPSGIAVVDDVLTTGAHFKAMKRILSETYADVKIYGVFLARRVPGTE